MGVVEIISEKQSKYPERKISSTDSLSIPKSIVSLSKRIEGGLKKKKGRERRLRRMNEDRNHNAVSRGIFA